MQLSDMNRFRKQTIRYGSYTLSEESSTTSYSMCNLDFSRQDWFLKVYKIIKIFLSVKSSSNQEEMCLHKIATLLRKHSKISLVSN